MTAMDSKFNLYPKNLTPQLSEDLFSNPTSEYRGTPLWSWNTRLDVDQLKRQILDMKKMGLGGYHIHPRTGLATDYLGPEFMAAVKACADYGETLGMLTWLYDEDRWPSGAAGGLVTEDYSLRSKWLLWTSVPYGKGTSSALGANAVEGIRNERGTLLGIYEVVIENGYLSEYRLLTEPSTDRNPKARTWYAYLESARNSSWFNNQAYVDTLNPAAIRRFIEVTHEQYHRVIGDKFGSSVPAIFTDEPQFTHKKTFATPHDTHDLVIPFTTDFYATYAARHGERLEDRLPELFWELPNGEVSSTRYRYHDHVAERFAEAYADQIGNWCSEHGIALTGHMMEEPSLRSQTSAIGDAMRSLRSFQIPGIDMLCDWREYTTAKQAQSVAHQYGRSAVLSELYGVTNWDFTFVGHKAQGDWQAALGITVRVPHLSWVSMRGEAKRDFPATISYQSPWYAEYGLIENHFARVNTLLTRGKPLVRVGVIHPIESYWICYGPNEQTSTERNERDQLFDDITHWLIKGLIDFDYIAESLLYTQTAFQTTDRFQVGEMHYDVIIVPGMRTIRGTTMDQLEQSVTAGGKVIFAGEIPTLVDAMPSDRAQRLSGQCQHIELSQSRILAALTENREISILLANGEPPTTLIHQIREDGDQRHVFIVNTERVEGSQQTTVRFQGEWKVILRDTLKGVSQSLPSRLVTEQASNKWTEIDWTFQPHGHLLVTLEPGVASTEHALTRPTATLVGYLNDPVPVKLSEPNVLLLDLAEWKLDPLQGQDVKGTTQWQPREEVLRIESRVRRLLGLPDDRGDIAQPWTDKQEPVPQGRVHLKYIFTSDVDVTNASIALEDPQMTTIQMDGRDVQSDVNGWWVDEDIKTVPLPDFGPGIHEIVLSIEVGRKSVVEPSYLLGDFGVVVNGSHSRIVEPVRTLTFGDWVHQGLPFYAGNVTYQFDIEGKGDNLQLACRHFKAPLLTVAFDSIPLGPIAFAPYTVDIGTPSAGNHTLEITAFGNRFNAFGQLHLPVRREWYGPESWRTENEFWSYEYQFRPMGLLTAPSLWRT